MVLRILVGHGLTDPEMEPSPQILAKKMQSRLRIANANSNSPRMLLGRKIEWRGNLLPDFFYLRKGKQHFLSF